MVVRQLPGWPIGPAALFEWLNARITRLQLLRIVDGDPFGAHEHFPILARVRVSGRVPPQLKFVPGEALRLMRWGPVGPDTDHLARAWCYALLVIAPGPDDNLIDVAAQLVESCCALGDDVPELAARLMAWRAISDEPFDVALRAKDEIEGEGSCDPVALLALLLLQLAADPADARVTGLARIVADAFTEPDGPPIPAFSVSAVLWGKLADTILAPLAPASADLDRLAVALHAWVRSQGCSCW